MSFAATNDLYVFGLYEGGLYENLLMPLMSFNDPFRHKYAEDDGRWLSTYQLGSKMCVILQINTIYA